MLRLILIFSLTLFVTSGCSCSEETGGTKGDGDVPDVIDFDVVDWDVFDFDVIDWDADVNHPVIACDGKIFQCANGLDDDGDGLIDSDDPNCLGPCDNNEQGYYPEIPGGISGAGGCTIDCYFDGDSGGGDDCHWDVKCDSLSPGESWGGSSCAYVEGYTGIDCDAHFDTQYAVRTGCESNCADLTPNGCDCFGCCLFPTAAEPNRYLLIGSREPGTTNAFGCTYEEATKPEGSELCAPCTPVPSCLKGCGECDICLGKDTIPDHCTNTDRCDEGVQPCGLPGDEACGEGFYCLTGCCVFFGVPG